MELSLKRITLSLVNRIGIDKSIAYSSGSKLISGSTGLLSIIFITIFLTEEEQGFYYTFGSIIALQVFFELGLTNIITQFVAHENAHIIWENNKILSGDEVSISRLGHMLKFTKKWYTIISIIFLFFILLCGIWFFDKYSPSSDYKIWLSPWILVTSATALNLFITPFLAILDGTGHIKDTSRIKFFQQLIVPIATWTSFVMGAGLYVVGIGQWCSVILTLILIFRSKLWNILIEINKIGITERIDYLKEVFPYQWKIALSWISGYFVFQLFNPILFATSGPIVAGQMGMSLTAINGIASFATSWISTKVPVLSHYIALKEYSTLDVIFNKTMKQLSMVCGVMLFALFCFVVVLNYFHLPLASRFLDLLPFLLLEISIFANQHGNGWATYLRCHKKEPLLVNSIVGAITCGLSTIFLGKYYGVIGMTSGYCILRIFLTYWNYSVYKSKKKTWHKFC